jgi:hypothetical protein
VDGIEILRKCDLIILDLILPPGKNIETEDYLGIDLLRRLREQFHVSTPILIFSVVAHATDVLSEADLKKYNAAAEFKPIRQERLMRTVYELMGLPFDEDTLT